MADCGLFSNAMFSVSLILPNSVGIPPPTVQLLLEELRQVDDWYPLGVTLGVPTQKLRDIQTSNSQGGIQRWSIDMFQYWLKSTPTASWKDVISALEQLEHLTLAARLKAKYMNCTSGKCCWPLGKCTVLRWIGVSYRYRC